jgi:hypothetical protein
MRTMTVAERIACRRVPEGAQVQAFEDVQAVAYFYEIAGRIYALAYAGTSLKPAINGWYQKGAEHRERHVRQWAEGLRAAKAAKDARKVERKAAVHVLTVGDIVVSSWGWEQTNVDFYQVTRVVSTRSVAVRPIASTLAEDGEASMTGARMPLRDEFEGAEFVRRAEGKRVNNVNRDHGASLWDGRPARCSWYA